MNKLFNTINSLFESDAQVTLTERGQKYMRPLPDEEIKDKGYSWAKDQVDDRGHKYSKGDTKQIASERYLYDVIKHLAPTGYHFVIIENGHGSRAILLAQDGDDKDSFKIADAKFEVDANDEPIVTVTANTGYGVPKDFFNRAISIKDVAQELAREKGAKVDDDFMIDNGIEIRKRYEEKKNQNTGTLEELVNKIQKQFNKLPAGGLMRQMESITISVSENLNEDTSDSEANYFKIDDKYITIEDGYGEECPYIIGGLESGEMPKIADRSDLSDEELWATGWIASVQNEENGPFSSFEEIELYCYDMEKGNEYSLPKLPEECKARFLNMVNQYIEDPSVFENESLTEDWHPSTPNWLKSAMVKANKGGWYSPKFTSNTEFEPVDNLKNLKNKAKQAEDNGQLLFVRLGNSVYWFNDRRWRSINTRDLWLSNEDLMDRLDKNDKVAAVISTNYQSAKDDSTKVKSDRREARAGSVERYPDERSRGYYDRYDKSGYLINPNKYKDMLKTIRQERLAGSEVIRELENKDYVATFNELGKQAAEFIGKNLNISINPDMSSSYSDSLNFDSRIVDRIKTAAHNASSAIKQLMRRVEFVKTGDEGKLRYGERPETTDIEGWLKNQIDVVDARLDEFRSILNTTNESVQVESETLVESAGTDLDKIKQLASYLQSFIEGAESRGMNTIHLNSTHLYGDCLTVAGSDGGYLPLTSDWEYDDDEMFNEYLAEANREYTLKDLVADNDNESMRKLISYCENFGTNEVWEETLKRLLKYVPEDVIENYIHYELNDLEVE